MDNRDKCKFFTQTELKFGTLGRSASRYTHCVIGFLYKTGKQLFFKVYFFYVLGKVTLEYNLI
jgi:hypothetical protein